MKELKKVSGTCLDIYSHGVVDLGNLIEICTVIIIVNIYWLFTEVIALFSLFHLILMKILLVQFTKCILQKRKLRLIELKSLTQFHGTLLVVDPEFRSNSVQSPCSYPCFSFYREEIVTLERLKILTWGYMSNLCDSTF